MALLAPGVGKLSYRMHRRGAAANWAMAHLFKGASKTLVFVVGGSMGSLQPQREGRSGAGLRLVHSPAPGTADVPLATDNGQTGWVQLVHPGPRCRKSHQPTQVERP